MKKTTDFFIDRPLTFRNRYFLMRHGQSEANESGIILSDPVEGTQKWGLSEEGHNQVLKESETFSFPPELLIYSSDFTRARQTAEITAKALNLLSPRLDHRLRERFFGDWEGTSNRNYEKIWEQDSLNSSVAPSAVEPVDRVRQRAASLVMDLEEKHDGQSFLLVSHGDTLQILQTWFMDKPAGQHRFLPHLNTAEIREMKID